MPYKSWFEAFFCEVFLTIAVAQLHFLKFSQWLRCLLAGWAEYQNQYISKMEQFYYVFSKPFLPFPSLVTTSAKYQILCSIWRIRKQCNIRMVFSENEHKLTFSECLRNIWHLICYYRSQRQNGSGRLHRLPLRNRQQFFRHGLESTGNHFSSAPSLYTNSETSGKIFGNSDWSNFQKRFLTFWNLLFVKMCKSVSHTRKCFWRHFSTRTDFQLELGTNSSWAKPSLKA